MRSYTDGAVVNGSDRSIDWTDQRVHMIGIGGAGMSGAAAVLLRLGAKVSGSDLVPFGGMGNLVARGARVAIGHRAQQLEPDVDFVVVSAAVPETNPELAASRSLGLPVMKYAELVGSIMRRHRRGIAIAGTHGKSTTTALCAHLCRVAGLDPSFLVGATSEQLGGSSGVGEGPHFIVESCEFDRSFLHFAPESAAILNIEPDHLDCFHDLEDIIDAFSRFGGNVAADGLLVCNGDDPNTMRAVESVPSPVETFGFAEDRDWHGACLEERTGCFAFDVRYHGETVLSSFLSIPGRYNVSNALAAIALAHHAGADHSAIADGLSTFSGVHRRMTWCGSGRGLTVVDDYAHHPTEIRVTIEAARSRYRPQRTWVIFQPHQNARTRHFMDEFAASLISVDEIIIPDVFGAREQDAGGDVCGSEELASRICRSGGHARYLPRLDDCAEHVLRHACEGDLVMTMGAGDVWKVADELVARIRQSDGA